MYGYYFLLDAWNTPHPSYLPLFFFIGVQGFALFLAVIVGSWRFVCGPQRLQTVMWLTLGFLPVFLWYSMVSLVFQMQNERSTQQVEMSWYYITPLSIAAAIFDGVGRWTLPHRLEGDRVVMFYDASITDPKGDLAKMDAFIKTEEAYLGLSMPTKIHWMRGALLGLPGIALSHIAIAQPLYSEGKTDLGGTDYHEAAHNIIGTPSGSAVYAGNYPPFLLIEGWAMARSEEWESLARECWQLKQQHWELTLREAVSDIYYNQTDGRLYQQGGAFVKVLCDKFGPEKFLELYQHCTRKTFDRDIEHIYGMSLGELDALYWHEIEAYRASRRSFDKATENCSPEEKALLAEFSEAYEQQVQAFYRLAQNGTLETVVHHGLENRQETLFQARDGQLMRFYEKGETTSKEDCEKREWFKYDLMTPSERIYVFQRPSSNESVPIQNSWRSDISPQRRDSLQQEFIRQNLRVFQPFSLFDDWLRNPDDYLWEPPTGTVIQSVVAEDDIVVLTLTAPGPMVELTLRIDRKQNWLLLEAKSRNVINGHPSESLVVYEYGEPIDGVPMLKKRSASRTGENYRAMEEVELVRFDPALVDESVFREENLPIGVPKTAKQLSSVQRMYRHWAIAGCWLVVPLLVILGCKIRGRSHGAGTPARMF